MVSAWKPHRCRVDDRVFCEQGFDVLGEGACRVDPVEQIGNVAQLGIESVSINLSVGNPGIRQMVRKVGFDYNVRIPKAGMMGTDVSDHGNTT